MKRELHLVVLVVLAAGVWPAITASQEQSKCLTCHQGIESIAAKPEHPHNMLACTDCHKGDSDATTLAAAHEGLVVNPTDLRVAGETCGLCHAAEVKAGPTSIMATFAGIISGARYQWAAQNTKDSLYGVRAVADPDGAVPEERGGLAKLEQLPTRGESGHAVDDYLRKECTRCHLWDKGTQRRGDYRSTGCAACHVLYAEDGLSRSGDKAIPHDEPGHPMIHQMTTRIPAQQCQICHNRGNRIGASFMGMMEQDPYGTPWTAEGEQQPKLHGKFYHKLLPDLHYERGLMCIDCHTSKDVHGDGNLYSKKEQYVEIRCRDCHGMPERRSDLKTSQGNPITNLRRRGGAVILTSKYDGRDHVVPQLADIRQRGRLPVAMQISTHIEKLECYACHATWVPQCYGCHLKVDGRDKQHDWLLGEETQGRWTESRSYLRWETPVLGLNGRGKVAPYMPGCQVLFTELSAAGKTLAHNKVFTTAAGIAGIASQPAQPHTIQKKARDCEDCHASRKAVGLGTGLYDPKANGLPIDFEWERIVDEQGNQLQDTSHKGARPLTADQIARVNRIGACIGCHKEYGT
ncbi:MAG: hypothetical protein ACE5JM_04010, partial [Armatimonadota bacterium]